MNNKVVIGAEDLNTSRFAFGLAPGGDYASAMGPSVTSNTDSVLDDLVRHAREVAPDRPELGDLLRRYFLHVDPADLAARPFDDLIGMASQHLEMARRWDGGIDIAVTKPRPEVDGWGSDRSLVQVVVADMPFLVDSVTMELSRLRYGIYLVVHPIMPFHADGRPALGDGDGQQQTNGDRTSDDDVTNLSLISVEVEPIDEPEKVESNIRRVLNDVTIAVADWKEIRNRAEAVAREIRSQDLPVSKVEQQEAADFIDWLAADHFLFLGARDYELIITDDGEEALAPIDGSGLGILSPDNPNRTSPESPLKLSDMSLAARTRVHEPRVLNLTKTSSISTVHRAAFMDYIGVKTFNSEGAVTGERRFLGLFTSEVYNRSATRIPRASRTIKEILERADFPSGGHDEKRLATVLELYPRDELLQTNADELFDTAIAIAGLQERRRVRVFSRPELFGRFITVLVYLPRDRYNTETRGEIEEVLCDAFDATVANWDAAMTESILARLRFVLAVADGGRTPPPAVSDTALEGVIENIIQHWDDGFKEAVDQHFDQSNSLRLRREFSQAFSADYKRAFSPRVAATDLEQIDLLQASGAIRIKAYRYPTRPLSEFKLKIYRRGARLSLTKVMPTLTNLGVTVVDETPYEVKAEGRDPVWIYDFALEHSTDVEFPCIAELVEDAFNAVWDGTVEDDPFNRLILKAGLAATDVAVLRAYAQYLQQVRLPYSPMFVAQTLIDHPKAAQLLFEYFASRFDPKRGQDTTIIEDRLRATITTIESLDHDRVVRRIHNAISATVRTNWAQRTPEGEPFPYLSVKLACDQLEDIPEPRPLFEIFTYSPRFEGVHLRAGKVARGGLRWSDRTEDYRTEVLGLVKAQMVKNAVIVPVGAKGGFVLKQRPADPTELRREVAEVYTEFVTSLLNLTDNLVEGQIVAPVDTVRYDDDDPYLVVAADKGTATFSDLANSVSLERGFWLGDAFASGGSQGYDHKAMGITARGAWESVKRHFGDMGVDVQNQPFTVVGVGDMSGDVFGNGMLRSGFIRLVAAFDHRHIFVDPTPDPESSFAERLRLFNLGRSSWDDYDRSLLSPGGAIYDRSAKMVELSAEAQAALGVEEATMRPEELISTVLKAPVDLLWNGGIGTYIKAADETNAEVGDKANDRIRVDGRQVRATVIGEGGNLGVTQRGRVEFARLGGRIYTDAIDNSGGVDSSDHEVNIKILLDEVVADGDLTTKQRNELLASMTDEVADLVLANNYRQALALAMARIDGPSLIDVHARYIDDLEQQGVLNRHLEFLPDTDAIADRKLAGEGLTAPELAVLSAYTKNLLSDELVEAAIIDDPIMDTLLIDYYPHPIRDRFPERILGHRLNREIKANRLANSVVDRAGESMLYRLGQETSAPATDIAAAHMAAWHIFDLPSIIEELESDDQNLPAERQLRIHLMCRQLAERVARLLILNRPNPFDPSAAVNELAEPVSEALAHLSDYLVGSDNMAFEAAVDDLVAAGASAQLAQRAAGLSVASAALDIVAVAAQSNTPIPMVAATYFAVGEELGLTWLRDQILALPRNNRWASQSRLTLRTDLYSDHRQLTARVIEAAEAAEFSPADADEGDAPMAQGIANVTLWVQNHKREVDSFRQTLTAIRSASASPDLTTLLVAAREVRTLITRTRT